MTTGIHGEISVDMERELLTDILRKENGGDYDKYYADQLSAGIDFQDHVQRLFYQHGLPIVSHVSQHAQRRGENMAGIEIKRDSKFRDTGNLFIEIAEKSHPNRLDYVSSGIYRNDNSWLYAIGDELTLYVFAITTLKRMCSFKTVDGYRFERKETKTARGFLLPVSQAHVHAARIFESGHIVTVNDV